MAILLTKQCDAMECDGELRKTYHKKYLTERIFYERQKTKIIFYKLNANAFKKDHTCEEGGAQLRISVWISTIYQKRHC